MFLLATTAFNLQVASAQTVEEARLPRAVAAIPDSANGLTRMVDEFRTQWSGAEDAQSTQRLAHDFGERLWVQAKARIHARQDYDDRTLYWTRLAMTRVAHEVKPAFPIFDADRATALDALEHASRGFDDIQFPEDRKVERILITGFDPFLLDRRIDQSNPSGVCALMLDGEEIPFTDAAGKTRSARIEAAIFPVRYADFDAGIVEDFMRPWMTGHDAKPHDWLDTARLNAGGRPILAHAASPLADVIVTISMGRTEFDLERYPGLARSATVPDNAGIDAGGTLEQPVRPSLYGHPIAGPEFVEISLPVAAMRAVQQPFAVNDNRWVIIAPNTLFAAGGFATLYGKESVEGSGGGYLSNEISYRTLRLRDELSVHSLPVGHLHTPSISDFDPKTLRQIVDEVREILTNAARSTTK